MSEDEDGGGRFEALTREQEIEFEQLRNNDPSWHTEERYHDLADENFKRGQRVESLKDRLLSLASDYDELESTMQVFGAFALGAIAAELSGSLVVGVIAGVSSGMYARSRLSTNMLSKVVDEESLLETDE